MTVMLAVEGLCKRFGGIEALRDVRFSQSQGEALGMIGPNGSGKTTFINVVTGQMRPDQGRVQFLGRSLVGVRPHDIARAGMVRTFQAVRLFSELSVWDNLRSAALSNTNELQPEDTARIIDLVQWLRLDGHLHRRAASLTLFEQRRLEVGMRLVLRPRLILLDEPVGGLAPTEIREMMTLLRELKSRCDLFIIEHTMKVIRELADRVVVLVAGAKVADGLPVEVLKSRTVIDHYLGAAGAEH
jgi:ABC-type branched-subunit amino acid transport system ATPase component